MTNAKKELLNAVADSGVAIKCAKLTFGDPRWYEPDDEDVPVPILLKVTRTLQEYEDFYKSIDRDYDSGYGGQELFGIVWLTDDTWLERGEYDGSEWWERRKMPTIPEELL